MKQGTLDSTRQRSDLLSALTGKPGDGAEAARLLDQYEQEIVARLGQTQEQYWQRREKEAQKLQQDFFSQLPFPALTGSADLVIEEVNPASIHCMQIEKERVVGRPVQEWLGLMNVTPSRIQSLMAKLNEKGILLQEELEIDCPTTGKMLLLLSISYITDLQGRRRRFQAMVQDITERRDLERVLAAEKAQIEAVFDSTPAGLIYADSAGVVRRINAAVCRIFSLPAPGEAVSLPMQTLIGLSPSLQDKSGEFPGVIDEVFSNPEARRGGVLELTNPERSVSYSVSPVRDTAGNSIGWFWIFADISERLSNEKLKNDLVHMIVHDLKNPLTVIRGATHMLHHQLTGDQSEALLATELIERNGQRMLGMIMNLLNIERLQTGRLELERTHLRLPGFLRRVLDDHRPVADKRKLCVEISSELEESFIEADANLLERVIGNLIVNAIKHTRSDGSITLKARSDAQGTVTIDVVDDGEGIPAQYHGKIFEKFGQAELRRQGRKTDTGLGLAFCKLAVEAHGGK
ncbi:PAS domain-containing protein, partial [Candidatus Sumerlaeota bacterium]|nr:PAS domain-containing protein [Candidatus Sumerlaeota bacterium]